MTNFTFLGLLFLVSLILALIKYGSLANSYKNEAWQLKFIEIWKSFVSFFLGGIIGYYFVSVRWNLLLKGEPFSTGDFVLIFIFNSNIITQRLVSSFNLKEGSNVERYKNWVQAADMIRDYPLGGVGLGNYARAVDPTAENRSSIYAHNLFLDIELILTIRISKPLKKTPVKKVICKILIIKMELHKWPNRYNHRRYIIRFYA